MKTIINCLNQIVNGQMKGSSAVLCPHSKVLEQVLYILSREGFIRGFFNTKCNSSVKSYILLKYKDNQPAIRNIVAESRPGLKSFKKYQELKKPLNGIGFFIMSTNKGLTINEGAFYEETAGQILFRVY
jgi:small subunit ribosomal protein S8